MVIDEEIETIESIIADIESAISEVKQCSYFEYLASGWEEDLKDLNERLYELQSMQDIEWKKELAYLDKEYMRGVI